MGIQRSQGNVWHWHYFQCDTDTISSVLGVEAKAEAAEIKSAFRKLALKLHPDVSDAPDANQQFAELSRAYGMHTSYNPPPAHPAPALFCMWQALGMSALSHTDHMLKFSQLCEIGIFAEIDFWKMVVYWLLQERKRLNILEDPSQAMTWVSAARCAFGPRDTKTVWRSGARHRGDAGSLCQARECKGLMGGVQALYQAEQTYKSQSIITSSA